MPWPFPLLTPEMASQVPQPQRVFLLPLQLGHVPVWSHSGIICTGETYRDKVKLTFMRGAALDDPHGLFNASLEGHARRAIDIREGDTLDEDAFVALVRAAVALNTR